MKFLTEDELAQLPSPKWLIERIIPENAFVVVYGEPGAGKTFVVLSMILSIGSDIEWCGLRCRQGATAYVAGEGVFGLKDRVWGFKRTHGVDQAHTLFLPEAVDLLKNTSVDDFLNSIALLAIKPKVIVLDTLARCFIGGDENSAKDMGIAVASIDRIRKETGSAVLVIHHTGKSGNSERGSSALGGAADVKISCEKMKDFPDLLKIKCDKMKDAEPFETISLQLHKVSLPASRTTLIVKKLVGEPPSSDASKNVEHAREILKASGAAGLTHSEFSRAYIAAKRSSKSTFNRTINILKTYDDIEVVGSGQGARYRMRLVEPVPNRSQSDSMKLPEPVPSVPFSRERCDTGPIDKNTQTSIRDDDDRINDGIGNLTVDGVNTVGRNNVPVEIDPDTWPGTDQ